MRKWTKSACVVLAWCLLPVLVTAGMTGSVRSAQANHHRIASSTTQVTLASEVSVIAPQAAPRRPAAAAKYVVQPGDTLTSIAGTFHVRGGWQALYAANRPRVGDNPNVIYPGTILVLPGQQVPVRYAVAAGDTLSVIAARLAVQGGWRALYTANRRAIGPDPDLIHPGAVLVAPRPAGPVPAQASPTPHSGHRHPQPSQTGTTAPTPTPASAPAPASTPRAGRQPTPIATQAPAGPGLPHWLLALLLAAGLLIAAAFVAEPAMVLGRRHHQASQARKAAEKARIVLADYDRLIVTYSTADDTVYVLTPPGEDPRAVLRAARLVLPDDTYEELASHLGVPANWPLE